MPVLALDTATEILSIAIADDSGLVGEHSIDAGRSHLEMLLPAIHDLLGASGFGFSDLSGIAAGIGPGTFSGLRVGVATARALAQALSVPVAASSTLDALARGLAEELPAGTHLLPLIDARRGQVFTRVSFIGENGEISHLSPVVCIDPGAVSSFVDDHTSEPVVAGGNGARAYREQLAAGSLDLIADNDPRNDVRAANHLANARFIQYDGADDLKAIKPVYVREPDADRTVLLRKREPWLK